LLLRSDSCLAVIAYRDRSCAITLRFSLRRFSKLAVADEQIGNI
jgi:hypothetical protein